MFASEAARKGGVSGVYSSAEGPPCLPDAFIGGCPVAGRHCLAGGAPWPQGPCREPGPVGTVPPPRCIPIYYTVA